MYGQGLWSHRATCILERGLCDGRALKTTTTIKPATAASFSESRCVPGDGAFHMSLMAHGSLAQSQRNLSILRKCQNSGLDSWYVYSPLLFLSCLQAHPKNSSTDYSLLHLSSLFPLFVLFLLHPLESFPSVNAAILSPIPPAPHILGWPKSSFGS